jgi:hypothetical protein
MAGWSPQGQVWLGFSRVNKTCSEMHSVARANNPASEMHAVGTCYARRAKCAPSSALTNGCGFQNNFLIQESSSAFQN